MDALKKTIQALQELEGLKCALNYTGMNWAVLPVAFTRSTGECSCRKPDCERIGKHPMTRQGVKDASKNTFQVRRWWEDSPRANIGIATGSVSGIVVLDVDVRDGKVGKNSLRDLVDRIGALPKTVIQISGSGGSHYFFQHFGDPIKSSFGDMGWLGYKDIDVIGEGGYVVAHPSRHETGEFYDWEPGLSPDEVPLAKLPDWMLDLAVGVTQPATTRDHAPAIIKGKRNVHLTSLAGKLRRVGFGPDQIGLFLDVANKEWCDPPLGENEVHRIAESISKKEPLEDPPDTGERSDWEEIEKQVGAVEWLWPSWIPRGYLTILAGTPGAGKTAFALWLARSVCLGEKWPDEQPGYRTHGKVVWCESEGSHSINLERAKNFGVPLDRFIAPTQNALDDFRLDNPDHLAQLEAAIKFERPALVVLDSFSASHGQKENDAKIQELLARLRRIASENGVAVVVIHHMRKPPAGSDGLGTLDDLRGSSAIGAVPRSVIIIATPNPDQPDKKIVLHRKNNLGVQQEPLGMTWVEDHRGFSLKFGPATTSYPKAKKPTEQNRAAQELEQVLADGPMPVSDLRDHMEDQGFNWETVKKAAGKIGVVKEGRGRKGGTWALPD